MLALLVPLLVAAPPTPPAHRLGEWTEAKGVRRRDLIFTDAKGEHLVRFELSAVKTKQGEEQEERSQELLVVHTVGKQELWRAKDFVQACAFDLSLELYEGGLSVTDLDGDGEAEVAFAYQLGCRSDVSPLSAKLLLYEGSSKYALRGESFEQVGEKEFAGGDFKADPAFGKAPPAFLEHASGLWKRVVKASKATGP